MSDPITSDADDASEVVSERRLDSLRKMAGKNFGKFAIQVQHMSEDVQKKLIEQLPEFQKLAAEALRSTDKAFQATLKSNDKSDKLVHEAYQDWRATLGEMLAGPDLTLDDKFRITAEIAKTVQGQHQLNAEGKNMKLQMFGKVVMGTAAVVVTVVVAVTGGKFMMDQSGNN